MVKKKTTKRKAKVRKKARTKRIKKKKKKSSKRKSSAISIKGNRINGLPAKQWAFSLEYIIDLCAKDAAIRAGYSKKTAEQIGWQLLQKLDVQQAIEHLLEQRAKRCGVHADRVVWELAAVAFSDIGDVLTFSAGGIKLKASTALTEKQRRAVSEVSETVSMTGGSMKVKMHSKLEALKTLAQHLGMTKGTVEVDVPDEGLAKVIFFPSNGREVTTGEAGDGN